MSKKVNPVAIGIFVVGASMLALISIMVFGAAKIFTKTEMAVCYFRDSINGLDVGAPVKYKGVTIGKVKDIRINVSKKDPTRSSISVYLSLDLNVIKRSTESEDGSAKPTETAFIRQINDGLRAKLAYQSIVTGMLYVELDYFANPGDKYALHNRREDILEIPVAASGLSDLAKKVEDAIITASEIDFKGIAENLNTLLVNTNKRIEDLDTKGINDSLKATLANLEKISGDERIPQALDNLNKLLADGDIFIKDANVSVKDLAAATSQTMKKLDGVLDELESVVSANSPARYELSLLLKNFGDAAISIKALADYIERNPNSLLTGKARENN